MVSSRTVRSWVHRATDLRRPSDLPDSGLEAGGVAIEMRTDSQAGITADRGSRGVSELRSLGSGRWRCLRPGEERETPHSGT
jgi:hypothetical protein